MDIFLRPPTCPALEAWETARTKLSDSVNNYMRLSGSLFETAMYQDMHPIILAERIDMALDFSHDMLERQLTLSRCALAQARNTLMSPAYCLPDEVFYEIFINVLYPADKSSEGESMDSAMRRIFPSLFTLMRVSRVWWDVILKRSEFWSLLPVYLGDSLQCLDTPVLGVRRARGPLHLAAIAHKDVLLIRRLIGLIPIPRIRSINISVTDFAAEQAIKELFLQFLGHMPSSLGVRELSLYRARDILAEDWIPDNFECVIPLNSPAWVYYLEIAKMLSVFRLSGVELRWDLIAFSDRLVELRLQRVIIGHDSDLADLLIKLVASPALQDLKLISIKTFSNDPGEGRCVLLPNLNSLVLEDLSFNTLRTVLRIIVPGSHRLTLFPNQKAKQIVLLGNPDRETISIETLGALLESVPVDTLLLAGATEIYSDQIPASERWLAGPELHTLLVSMPALKTLKTDTWVFTEVEWQAMTRNENVLFPRLENLHFSSAFIHVEEPMKSFVKSHPIRRMTLEGSLCTSVKDGIPSYDLIKGKEDIVEWLNDHVPRFDLEVRDPDDEEHRDPIEFCSDVWRLW